MSHMGADPMPPGGDLQGAIEGTMGEGAHSQQGAASAEALSMMGTGGPKDSVTG